MEMGFTDSRLLEPGDSPPGLRPLGWSELCARLVAAHDTRQVLALGTVDVLAEVARRQVASNRVRSAAGNEVGGGCSFHNSAASLLQTLEVETKVPVNPASSANGNDAGGNTDVAPNTALQGRPDETCHD
jgi:hypothetical protein